MRRARPMLGTIVELRAEGADGAIAANAIVAAFDAIARVERCMSFHDSASDVSRLNRQAHLRPVVVDPWTLEVLRLAQRVSEASAGAFDVTIAPVLLRWGLLPGGLLPQGLLPQGVRPRDRLPTRRLAQTSTRAQGSFHDIRISADGSVVFTRRLAIDLGGIAKGFAVDRAAQVLVEHGITDYVVNAGGDLRVGMRPEPIHVRHPIFPDRCLSLGTLVDSAVATSARYSSRVRVRGREVHPIVVPATGNPAPYRHSVSILAPTCVIADALTKVAAILGVRSAAILDRFQARAIVIRPSC